VFRQAVAELRDDVARADGAGAGAPHARLRAADVAMVGDDPRADVAAARRAGLRGILVLSGKVDAAEAATAPVRIDAVAASLAEVVAALGQQ
jgi:ribonucleotide monophosphatase NagD (HAD superfamily)